jgi:hypothetical protein
MHDDFTAHETIKTSSNRTFGLVFTVVFVVLAVLPLFNGAALRWWAMAVAGVLLCLALAVPQVLSPLNRAWIRLGFLLHRVMNPLILGVLFFLVVTPTAWIMRVLGKRPLTLDRDPNLSSYWVMRDPPGPEPESMKRQF